MENNAQSSGGGPPPKPWERAGSSSGPAPFKPSSPGNTSDVVEASGTAQPGEVVSTTDRSAAVNRNTGRPVLLGLGTTDIWKYLWRSLVFFFQLGYGHGQDVPEAFAGVFDKCQSSILISFAPSIGFGMHFVVYALVMVQLNYNSGYGSGTYGSYGGMGGTYGGGCMEIICIEEVMVDSMEGACMVGECMVVVVVLEVRWEAMEWHGGPYGDQDPNNPFGAPPSPPGFWISLMRVMQGVVTFFGRVAMLIDQNTQAFHMFMTALLQLFDRSGMLYGELARFVLRILGVKTKPKKVHPPGVEGLPGPHNAPGRQSYIEGPKPAPSGAWDGVWGDAQ
ncbi:UNVERIFIED_CONTAM: Peroxisomal membrane protein 13 [Sesamum calycinum]|uniref:Peroxin-13 n=1 Tax=Sesamum calycinum TaxID=2727403 RepID=A0AAW2SF75_9LAMI